jgi:short-subunit dehydrogenase
MQTTALLIGNSDGIGYATTRRLLSTGWKITGISRSDSPIKEAAYQHKIADVSGSDYPAVIAELAQSGSIDLCIYFAGIGELLNLRDMSREPKIIDVNLTGMVKTAAAVIPRMVKEEKGHFIGISSFADELLSAEAPSYHASKAGFSNYLGSLALALKRYGVYVTNLRFGFVDTKMAKGDVKPFMMSIEKAVDHIETCIRKKPARYTAPQIAIPLVKFRKLMMRFGAR